MSTFTFIPSYGVSLSVKPNVFGSKFGDGYEQRSVKGINNKPRVWGLRFTGTESNLDLVIAFFETHNGVTSFDWTPPNGAAGKWLCREWSRNFSGFNNEEISVTFQEVFGE